MDRYPDYPVIYLKRFSTRISRALNLGATYTISFPSKLILIDAFVIPGNVVGKTTSGLPVNQIFRTLLCPAYCRMNPDEDERDV